MNQNLKSTAERYTTLRENDDPSFCKELTKTELKILEDSPAIEDRLKLLAKISVYPKFSSYGKDRFAKILENDEAFLLFLKNFRMAVEINTACNLYSDKTEENDKTIDWLINLILQSKNPEEAEKYRKISIAFKALKSYILRETTFYSDHWLNEAMKDAITKEDENFYFKSSALLKDLVNDIAYFEIWLFHEDSEIKETVVNILELNSRKDMTILEFLNTARKIKECIVDGNSDFDLNTTPLVWIESLVD